jgi:hypothetical protein
VSGIAASSLIVLAPVKQGAEDRLRTALAGLQEGELSPFAGLGGTHFARWVLVPALPGPDGTPIEPERSYLLMCADFDATVVDWAAGICANAGDTLGPIMECWEDFPGTTDPQALRSFLLARNAAAGFTVAGYRRATVEEVRDALRLRFELRSLASRAQNEALGPEALLEQWRAVGGR